MQHVADVILDECDEMLSMGCIEDIERVALSPARKKQTLLFSAGRWPESGSRATRSPPP